MLHFRNMHHLNESFDYTMKNLLDMLGNMQYNSIRSIEEKIKTVKSEFFNHYQITDYTNSELLKAIEKYNKENVKAGEIIDFAKVDQFHHLKLYINLEFGRYFKDEKTLAHIYTIYYHICHSYEFPSYMSKYTLPHIVDNRFCIFITFDESEIEEIDAVVSENMFDISANVYLDKLSVNTNIFKKEKK